MKNAIIFTIVVLLAMIILAAGGRSASTPFDINSIKTYKDIPGITEDEIKAIEELQKRGTPLIYGTSLTTEAFIDEDGELGGFAVLLCDWLTELFGIQFKTEIYVLSDVLAKLKTGEISFGTLTATPERLKTYYMTDPIIHRSTKVMRLKGRPSPDEIVSSRPVRYVLMEGTSLVNTITSSLAPGSYEAAVAKDHETVYQMLSSGEADVFVGINVAEESFDSFGGVIAEDFLPLTVSAVSLTAEDPALAPIISVITKALGAGAYEHLTELYRQGYQDYRKNKFLKQLSDEERAYVRNTPVIPFAAHFMTYPGSFYNTSEKKWDGIIFDILDEMEKLTGFTFKLVNGEKAELPELMDLLEAGTAYTMPNLIQSNERRKRFIWSNTIYMLDRFALLSKRSYPNIELNDIPFARVGFTSNSAFSDLFRSWFPNALYTIEYPSTNDAFMALERGEVDLVMSNQSRLTALTNLYELSDYKANYLFNTASETSFGLNKNQTVLCSIIDKALPLIDTSRIVEQWLSRTYDIETMRLREQRPWLLGSLALFLCVLSLVAILFIRSRRTGKRLERLVEERTRDLEMQTSMLTTIINSSPDFIFCKDLNSRYTQCNKSMEKFFNITSADVIGQDDVKGFRFSPETAEKLIKEDQRIINEKHPIGFEELVMAQSDGGKELVVETIKAPLILDGEVIGVMGIARDVTKRKKIERELAMQTAVLTTLFDSIPDLIFAKDLEFRYMQCNKSFLDHAGIRKEDLIGKDDLEGIKLPAELVNEYRKWDRRVMREGRRFIIEEHIPGVNGTNPLYEMVKAPLVLDGEVIGILGIAHDITKRKEMEDAALTASRSKSVFLANMSHEIRTPMNSIIGFSELAMDSEASEKTREYLAKIQTNAEWLLQIINDILDISKIESGRMELENIPFDMHELFESCRTLIMPKAVEKGISLQFYAEPSVGKRPLGDPTRLRQILVNLLSNAVKFTNSGTVKILTEIKEKSEKTVTFHFEIKDSGIGMTEEQIRKIFEPFIQAETGTTRKYGGTGLGLAISKNFIELMGGQLAVESAPGIGSKFSFDLTFDTIDISSYEKIERKAVLDEIDKPVFDGEVLLCEDNMMNQQVICEHLARVGLKTVVAENGKAGVEAVQSRKRKGEKQFDLIFMDIHMPVMDGIEAATKILELGTGIPIVAMTANVMSNDRETYKESGMHDCISKPFTSQELWRCLLKYLPPVGYKAMTGLETIKDEEGEKKLLAGFVKSHRNTFSDIQKALDEGDIKLAHRLAHTLKGTAGLVGRTKLRDIAHNVEKALADNETETAQGYMDALERVLSETLAELEALSAGIHPPRSPSMTLNAEQARGLLEKLEPLLKTGNLECLEMVGSLRTIEGSDTLIEQIEDFDFQLALKTLVDIKQALETQ